MDLQVLVSDPVFTGFLQVFCTIVCVIAIYKCFQHMCDREIRQYLKFRKHVVNSVNLKCLWIFYLNSEMVPGTFASSFRFGRKRNL